MIKIYEIRDITSDENYYPKKYCVTKGEAVEELKRIRENVSDFAGDADCVIGAVFEHEVGIWDHEEGFDKKIFEMTFTKEYVEKTDEYIWEARITFTSGGL